MKNLCVLGSTGSIGVSTLKVVAQFPGKFRVRSMTAGLDTLTASAGSVSGKIRINYSNYTLVIDSLSQTVPPGQGTIVRATLKNAGTPVPGRRLAYSVSASRGSQIREQPPYSWTTDTAGHARAVYTAGNTAGFDTVTVADSTLDLTGLAFISIGNMRL